MMMETLVFHARNQYHNKGKAETSRGFKGINCRTFQSSEGILRPPHAKEYPLENSSQAKSPPKFYSEPPKARRSKSSPIPISASLPSPRAISFNDDYDCSELWAGPAYSNSPPPSSVPMPKFPLRQKRSVSLELTDEKSHVVVQPISKSAPSSPSREYRSFVSDFHIYNATATEDLKRILNLDVADD